MRTDEEGNQCPSTLGEYKKYCLALGGSDCKAVAFLNRKIAETSEDEEVIAPDSQMRMILYPWILAKEP